QMSAPEPVMVNAPPVNDALPGSPTLPMSRVSHDGVTSWYIAVYVALVAGIVMLWLAAPASGHSMNWYVLPPTGWSDGAFRLCMEPAATLALAGATTVAPSSESEIPAIVVERVSVTGGSGVTS